MLNGNTKKELFASQRHASERAFAQRGLSKKNANDAKYANLQDVNFKQNINLC